VRTHKFIQRFEITFKTFHNFLLVTIRFCMFHPFFCRFDKSNLCTVYSRWL
jgi:hypothetical protein